MGQSSVWSGPDKVAQSVVRSSVKVVHHNIQQYNGLPKIMNEIWTKFGNIWINFNEYGLFCPRLNQLDHRTGPMDYLIQ